MKKFTLIFVLSCFISPSFSQSKPSDKDLTDDVVGTWQHVTSTDSEGHRLSYQRQIELYADGSGNCIKYDGADTINLAFFWDVHDGVIMLYVLDKNGKKINTDSQLISDVDASSLNLSNVFGDDEYGISSLYRKSKDIVAEY
jgi:hypothetical protein